MVTIGKLANAGDHSAILVGQMGMNNQGGKADINIKEALDTSKFGMTKIGLMNLDGAPPPLFDNRGGSRMLNIKESANAGDHTTFNVGQMAMNNQGGKADINMGSHTNSGKFSVTNIGLQNLAAPLFDNRGGSRLISIKDLLD